MREILFRGQVCCGNGRWAYGSLLQTNTTSYIVDKTTAPNKIDNGYEEVVRVCQFTGLNDKSRTKIFERDIVRYYDDSEDELVNGVVIYNTDFCSFCVHRDGYEDVALMGCWEYEVISNIYDNPKLLEDKQ